MRLPRLLAQLFDRFQAGRRAYRCEALAVNSMLQLVEREDHLSAVAAFEMPGDARVKRRATREAWHRLSKREQEVVALYCLGYTTIQIARRLYVSNDTAKSHLRNAIREFGLQRRAELLALLMDWDFSAWKGAS